MYVIEYNSNIIAIRKTIQHELVKESVAELLDVVLYQTTDVLRADFRCVDDLPHRLAHQLSGVLFIDN